jgi:hypothetical protein
MTNDETPKYPREIRRSKPRVEGSDRDTLFRRNSRFEIRHSFVLGYLGASSFPGFRTREKSGLAGMMFRSGKEQGCLMCGTGSQAGMALRAVRWNRSGAGGSTWMIPNPRPTDQAAWWVVATPPPPDLPEVGSCPIRDRAKFACKLQTEDAALRQHSPSIRANRDAWILLPGGGDP